MPRNPDSPLIQRIRRNRRLLILGPLALALGIAATLSASHIAHLNRIVTDRFEGRRWSLPSKLYSDSFIVHPGQEIAGIELSERLRRLGYHPVAAEPGRAGEYRRLPGRLDLYLHDFTYPDREAPAYPVRLVTARGRIQKIVDRVRDEPLPYIELEPELIAAFYDETWEERDLVRLSDVSPYLIRAVLAVEDARFYEHHGVDLRGIARALWVDLKSRAIVQGGSTITQQLVKNFYLDQRRTVTRKANEILMALLLEMHYGKDEIIEAYLNEIYFGQGGAMGIYGVGQASRFYYGKRPKDLTLAESALLAGVINSPGIFSPFIDPAMAAARQRIVLDRMRTLGLITDGEYDEAVREPFRSPPPIPRRKEAPYFVDFVRKQLAEDYPPEVLASEGLRIFSTLDMQLQRRAEASLAKGLDRLESRYPGLKRPDPADRIQGALIALQPQTGYIRAMVGGRNYGESQFNRVTQARRQPGSLFKAFVYAAAVAGDGGSGQTPFTPATLLEDSPVTIPLEDGAWSPKNYDGTYHGRVTVSSALEKSLNAATVRLSQEVGTDSLIAMARALGITSPLDPVPSLALGTSEVTPLEMAVGYAAIANGGVRPEPLTVREVVLATGAVAERRSIELTEALSPQEAYVMTSMLEGVVERGTARGVRNLGVTGPVAGKTGTSSDYRDAWFSGFTPDLEALVWVGFDQGAPAADKAAVPLTGANAALPIWADFIQPATAGRPAGKFAVPPGVIFRTIDPETGTVAGLQCPGGVKEAFVAGTEPVETCGKSIGVAKGLFHWFKGLFSTD